MHLICFCFFGKYNADAFITCQGQQHLLVQCHQEGTLLDIFTFQTKAHPDFGKAHQACMLTLQCCECLLYAYAACCSHMLLAVQEWTALAKMVFRLKPLQRNNPPENKTRLACYRVIQTKVGPFTLQCQVTSAVQLHHACHCLLLGLFRI